MDTPSNDFNLGVSRTIIKQVNNTNEEIKENENKTSLYGSPSDKSNKSFLVGKNEDFTSSTKLNL